MKRYYLFLTLLILTTSLVTSFSQEDFEKACIGMGNEKLNDFQIPDFVPYSDEIFNLYIQEENLSGSIIIENSSFKSIACENNKNATYEIHIKNLNTVEDIVKSEDFLGTYNEKIGNNEIEIKGVTVGKKIKMVF